MKQRNGNGTMYSRNNEKTSLGNGFAKEFTALSSLCAAGYLWLLLI